MLYDKKAFQNFIFMAVVIALRLFPQFVELDHIDLQKKITKFVGGTVVMGMGYLVFCIFTNRKKTKLIKKNFFEFVSNEFGLCQKAATYACYNCMFEKRVVKKRK